MEAAAADTWPLVLAIVICVMCVAYLWGLVGRYGRRRMAGGLEGVEAFTDGAGAIEQRLDDRCYDAFYSKVYDSLVQPAARAGMEIRLPIEWLEKQGRAVGDIRVADVGCGTGLQVELFAQAGVGSVVGYDRSEAMVAEARRRWPEREFVLGDATVATMMAAESVDLLTLFYFTIYMVPDRTAMLKNFFLWLAPGGLFVCHVVNKLKFDPVLESASPFVGFSIQKYADERITQSNVTFDEFDYLGDFQLHGSRGVYEETFRFRDGRVRRHEQRVWMPNIEPLVKEITDVGFKLVHHVDLTPIGYEYQYLFFFSR